MTFLCLGFWLGCISVRWQQVRMTKRVPKHFSSITHLEYCYSKLLGVQGRHLFRCTSIQFYLIFCLFSYFFILLQSRAAELLNLVEVLADIFLTVVVAIQLRSAVQRRPLRLILEESHGMNVLGFPMS